MNPGAHLWKPSGKSARLGIFPRFAAMFLVVLLIPFTVTLLAMNDAFQRHDFNETLRSQRYSMSEVTNRFEQFFGHIDQQMMDMIYSQAMQDSLVGKGSRAAINAVVSAKSYKEGIYIAYLDNRGALFSSSIVAGFEDALTDKLPHTDLFGKINASYAGLQWSLEDSDLFSPFRMSNDPKSLFAGRHVRHLDLNVSPGYLMVQTMPQQIASLMDDPLMRSGTRYLLLDESGEVVSDSAAEGDTDPSAWARALLAQSAMGEDYFYGDLGLGRSLHIFGTLNDTGLTLVSALPDADIRQSRNELNQLLISVTLAGTCGALLLALLFSLYYSRPIMQITRAMRRVRGGDFGHKVDIHRTDEIGEMALTFNVMTDDIKALLFQTRQDQQDLKHAEINALIYQINPHFLYNTLDSIHMLAKRTGDERIPTLIMELSRLLRITLSGGREEIRLGDELRHVDSYLKIMQLRNDSLFNYEVQAEDALLDLPVLKFILQPLAENAINHGMNYTESDGLIRVSAKTEGRALRLSVEDNGIGMDEEQIRSLKEGLRGEHEDKGQGGVGLSNVYRRLKIHYGDADASMEFASSGLGGLWVSIVIAPFRMPQN